MAGGLLGACATTPPTVEQYSVDIPSGLVDGRARFREIFCAVLAARPALADYRSCEEALSPVSGSLPADGRSVELGASARGLVAAVVPGIGWGCFENWLDSRATAAAHVSQFGYGQVVVAVDALSGSETNARQIRDAIMQPPLEAAKGRLVLVGYSKGAPDILEALVRYPEIVERVVAMVSVAGAVGGSPLADDAGQWQADLLRHWPDAKCGKGDEGAVDSLRPDVRKAWMTAHPLPDGPAYYSLVTLPLPERVSRILRSSYRKIGKSEWRNDSQMIYLDQFVPGSTVMGFLNADHWAVAVPINRTHPTLATRLVTQNAYPREALLEAVLRYVEEDLSARERRNQFPR
jgi:pimeloyl-ACP methyl ester carboxylesterase